MANLKFLKGLYQSLDNAAIAEGQILITKDTREMFVDVDASTRIKIGDFTVVSTIAELEALDATKVPTSRLYYVEDGNILARSNGTTWIQVNKQKSASELKEFLGLQALAYKSEVAEADLNSDLAAKINAASGAQHTHANADELDKIADGDVAKWNAAEQNAKDYADGLNTAMNTRVEALEAIDHSHTFLESELNKIVDGDVAKWNAAAEKAHAHTFVESELNKIADGDVAKWNAVVADHLDSEDKAALENAIKEAKKAGTDANTNIETYKVTNDARVLAVEEDIAEIVDAEGGILAQAKSYSDNKLATARTEISAEIDADVKAVADDLAGYKTSNDAALAGVKATADAAATKAYTDEELAKKVDKVTGKSLVDDAEITKLAGVSAGANKVEASENNGKIKIDGVETTVYTHPAKHNITDIEGLQEALDGKQGSGDFAAENHKHTKEDITDFAHTHVASEITDLDATIKSYDYATKTELGDVDAKFANYNTTEAQKAIDDAQDARIKAIEDDYVVAADIADFETKENVKKVADDLAAYVESNDAALAAEIKARTDADADFETRVAALEANFGDGEGTVEAQIAAAIAAEQERAEGVESGLDTRVKAIEDDYLKASDKTELAGLVTAEKERAEGIEGGLRTDVDAIKADYLTSADKTELEGKITAEENRAKGVEESLQTQINTIMNNPDTEGVINSINEFTQYIADHGEIAEGFRTDIDKNKEDIAANAKAISDHEALAAETYETKSDASAKLTEAKGYTDTEVAKDRERLTALEAVKDDYKTADATLKSELQAEIDADVKVVSDALEAAKTEFSAAIEEAKVDSDNKDAVVLAEAQAYADAAKAEAIADAASKYETKGTAQGIVDGLKLSETYEPIGAEDRAIAAAKSETEAQVAALASTVYTKEEVDAAVEAAVETAMQWAEF